MSEKTIVYYYDVCGLSPQDIAKKLNTAVERIRQVLGKTPRYRPVYAPRKRYNAWVNGQ